MLKKEKDEFGFMRNRDLNKTAEEEETEMLRREKEHDAAWYDAEEDGNVAYDQSGGNLFDSYAEQEVQEHETRLKHQMNEIVKMKKQQNQPIS